MFISIMLSLKQFEPDSGPRRHFSCWENVRSGHKANIETALRNVPLSVARHQLVRNPTSAFDPKRTSVSHEPQSLLRFRGGLSRE